LWEDDSRIIFKHKIMLREHPENNGPLTWIGSFPVYASTALAGVHGITLILTALAMAAGAEAAIQAFAFNSTAVTRDLSLWQMLTYAFVHRPPYWFFLIELYLLVVFGKEIETYLGRAAFLKLYLFLLLLPPIVLTAGDWLGWPTAYWGSSGLHFGIFVAFALLYPTAEIFFGIQAKWIALALLAINSLQCLALTDYTALTVLAVDCVAACYLVGRMQGRFRVGWPRRVAKVAPPLVKRTTPRRTDPPPDVLDSIDPILEKISRDGIASLTPREREHLEKARARLIAEDGGS
jgi:membrane associated rhomboid family serine protease